MHGDSPLKHQPLSVAITALAPLTWGTTYLVTTEFLPPNRPMLAGCLRALPAGIALAMVHRVRPSGTWWLRASALGVLNIGGFFALLFVAAYRLPGGIAATLGAIQPLLAVWLAAGLIGERVRRGTVVAGVTGLIGVALLVMRPGARLDGVGIAAGLGAATSMALGVVLTKRWGRPVDLLTFTSWQLISGGLFLLPFVVFIEGVPASLSLTNVAGYAWLASIGGAIAYAVWFRGIGVLPIAQVTILGLISPLMAGLLGWAVLDQSLRSTQLIGMAAILAAVGIAQTRTTNNTNQPASSSPRPHTTLEVIAP